MIPKCVQIMVLICQAKETKLSSFEISRKSSFFVSGSFIKPVSLLPKGLFIRNECKIYLYLCNPSSRREI